MNYEAHTIREFRGTNFGIIRLNELSRPNRMKILIGGIEIRAIGYDTYGHPIISESDFIYYNALQNNYKRSEKTFMAEVWYEPNPFCIRRDIYDSIESIQKIVLEEETIEDVIEYKNEDERKRKEAEILKKKEERQNQKLGELKKLLVYRKRAAFLGNDLKSYLLYKTYILSSDGRIYFASDLPKECLESLLDGEDVIEFDEKIISAIQLSNEVHIPDSSDVCTICGKRFTLNDVKDNLITENERVEKVHRKCHHDFTIEVELNEASLLIDALYEKKPNVEITTEWDDEDKKEKRWYHYKTNQGTISICFKHEFIVIIWHEDFKLNMGIFDAEDVTKYKRGIQAHSKDDALRYLMMAKNA